MGDLVQFVDSLDASATVRLDLNDEGNFWVKRFDALPPRLRRSMASNSMRDGIHVGTSTYDARTLVIEMECIKATQDEAATQIQALWRELDRANNWIKYQPNGLTKPVFFRTYRSDTSQLEDVIAQAAMRTFTIEVLAEPFALGLPETLGPYAINNDPAAGTNPCYVDLPTILGDVPAPLVLWDDATSDAGRYLVSTHATTAVPLTFAQAESMTLGTDTTNPGAGPDAAMSGTGTNNYARTSFATTATMDLRLTWALPATAVGSYRALVFARAATGAAGAEFQLGCSFSLGGGGGAPDGMPVVTFADISGGSPGDRTAVDLGIIHLSAGAWARTGYAPTANSFASRSLYLFASRVASASALDWDAVLLLPVGGQVDETHAPTALIAVNVGANPVFDAVTETVASRTVAGDPTTGAATFSHDAARVAGAFPEAAPGSANRLFLVRTAMLTGSPVGASTTVSGTYWPHYMHVRPIAS